MKKTVLFTLLTFTTLLTYSTETWLKGSWEGKGLQIDGQSWNMKLSVTDLKQVYVEYADLKCSGVWNYIQSKGKKLCFTEQIDEGTENCDQGCEITVQQHGNDEIKVAFVLKRIHKSKPIATAFLKRIAA